MPRDNDLVSTFRPKLLAVSVAICFAANAPLVLGNPTGPTVTHGSALFGTVGNTLTVTNSANAIIQWQGFSIGINEITRFMQPSAASAVLNRVVGSGGVIPQSLIDGVLSSNGRVFLLNPMGVVIGANARIDVAGLVASSLNLSDQDFLGGNMRFTEVPGAGGVLNHGIIETPGGGRVFLVAPHVENTGIIRSPQGEIVLAAGKSAELLSESSPYVTVRVVADTERALNVGSLIADSGRIGMYGALLRHGGVAEASGATVGPGGQIRFVATRELNIDAGSRISASGTSGGEVILQAVGGTNTVAGTVEATGSAGKGGTVQVLGVRVGVVGNGVIDASGETGGGTVLVGGDYQGKNASVQNAQSTLIGDDGVIRADARTSGDGGRVIVWADGDTRFHGHISARGGSQSGNGGFVETSGKQTLTIARGSVDARAPRGKAGKWLLDPAEWLIDAAQADAIESSFGAYGGFIEAYGGNITFADHLNLPSYGGGGSLSLTASDNINLNTFNISTIGATVSLTATSGAITSSPGGGNITTNGAQVTLSAGTSVAVGNINTTGGSGFQETRVSITANNGFISTGSITTGNTSDDDSDVYIYAANGNVTTGSIATGNSEWDSSVYIATGISGGSITTGNITTGNAGEYTYVRLQATNGSISTGNIQTGNASFDGGEGGDSAYSYVYMQASNGSISTGTITTGNAVSLGGGCCDQADSSVTLYANGSVSTGNVQTGIAVGDGGEGNVYVQAGTGIFMGSIVTGFASEESRVDLSTTTGNVVTGAIFTGTAPYSTEVNIDTGSGDIVTGSITTGAAVDNDSDVRITTDLGGIATGAITTGFAGDICRVRLTANSPSTITTGDIITGDSYDNSSVDIIDSFGSVITGSIRTGNTIYPWASSYVRIQAASGITTGSITTSPSIYNYVDLNTTAGDVRTGSIITRSSNPYYGGGMVHLRTQSGSVHVNGIIDTSGAAGIEGIYGAGGPNGSGSYGGDVDIYATNTVNLGPPATPGVIRDVIITSGGNAAAVSGAYGGDAGSVFVDPAAINIQGVILATGGAGGPGGPGGAGGHLDLLTPNSSGVITFFNGGWDLSGGAGSPPGSSGTATIEGTLVFITLLNDVLSNPAIAQAVGATIKETLDAPPEDEEESEEDQEKKGKFGSCKAGS